MDKQRIIEILNRWNFWNKDLDIGVLRPYYLGKFLAAIKLNKILSVVGLRRSGKSTLLKQMARE